MYHELLLYTSVSNQRIARGLYGWALPSSFLGPLLWDMRSTTVRVALSWRTATCLAYLSALLMALAVRKARKQQEFQGNGVVASSGSTCFWCWLEESRTLLPADSHYGSCCKSRALSRPRLPCCAIIIQLWFIKKFIVLVCVPIRSHGVPNEKKIPRAL